MALQNHSLKDATAFQLFKLGHGLPVISSFATVKDPRELRWVETNPLPGHSVKLRNVVIIPPFLSAAIMDADQPDDPGAMCLLAYTHIVTSLPSVRGARRGPTRRNCLIRKPLSRR